MANEDNDFVYFVKTMVCPTCKSIGTEDCYEFRYPVPIHDSKLAMIRDTANMWIEDRKRIKVLAHG